MISAEIIADSISEQGNRITSFVLTFPRIILAEFNTHRQFSRNSASSRAIPAERMIEMVQNNPFIPIAWQKSHKGMQGVEYLDEEESQLAIINWLEARDSAVEQAKKLLDNNVTKQLVNRILEPFMYHTVIVTATEWSNFFALRCPQYEFDGQYYKSWKNLTANPRFDNLLFKTNRDRLLINKSQAEIHIQAVAELMWDAMNESEPKLLKEGQWHIPFGDNFDHERLVDLHNSNPDDNMSANMVKIATARCARVSYLNYEGKDDYYADVKLHDRLAKSGHWSPFEHCATACSDNIDTGNFKGFKQYRKMFHNECL